MTWRVIVRLCMEMISVERRPLSVVVLARGTGGSFSEFCHSGPGKLNSAPLERRDAGRMALGASLNREPHAWRNVSRFPDLPLDQTESGQHNDGVGVRDGRNPWWDCVCVTHGHGTKSGTSYKIKKPWTVGTGQGWQTI
jgi:hypothetical protein